MIAPFKKIRGGWFFPTPSKNSKPTILYKDLNISLSLEVDGYKLKATKPTHMVVKSTFIFLIFGKKEIFSGTQLKTKKIFFDRTLILSQYGRSPKYYLLVLKQL